VGTIALICTAACVVATIASFCLVMFVHPQANWPPPDLQGRPCDNNFAATDQPEAARIPISRVRRR
jgi:hypothetical protein